MKLYLLSQDVNNDYDTYDSCVVAAENEEDATRISPSAYAWSSSWCEPKDVKCKYIGEADKDVETGVICASFNAG